MEKWLEIPKDRPRLPVGRLCLVIAMTVVVLLAHMGRERGANPAVGATEAEQRITRLA